MEEVMYNRYANEALDTLAKGAFLTVSSEGKDNPMTIGWGSIGYMWKKPVFTVMVRYSRYSYELIEKSDCFTISLPIHADMKEALKYCGCVSGRDHDKWQQAHLTKLKAPKVDSVFVGECDLFYECKIIGRVALTDKLIDKSVNEKCYKDDDYHVLYYGEIVGTYVK